MNPVVDTTQAFPGLTSTPQLYTGGLLSRFLEMVLIKDFGKRMPSKKSQSVIIEDIRSAYVTRLKYQAKYAFTEDETYFEVYAQV